MKKYEIGFRDGDNFDESGLTLWIQTDGKVETPGANVVYCKEIEIPDNAPGVDIVVKPE